jgi:hypothetical protein
MRTSQPRLFAVELLESEKVVPYGVARQSWSVSIAGRWLSAHGVPGASVKQLPNGPGSVWERIVELKLPAGTRLELKRETPRPRSTKDTFRVLTLDQASNVVVKRMPHQVAGDGTVVLVRR